MQPTAFLIQRHSNIADVNSHLHTKPLTSHTQSKRSPIFGPMQCAFLITKSIYDHIMHMTIFLISCSHTSQDILSLKNLWNPIFPDYEVAWTPCPAWSHLRGFSSVHFTQISVHHNKTKLVILSAAINNFHHHLLWWWWWWRWCAVVMLNAEFILNIFEADGRGGSLPSPCHYLQPEHKGLGDRHQHQNEHNFHLHLQFICSTLIIYTNINILHNSEAQLA